MAESYSLENYVQDLRRISGDTEDEDEIIRRVGPLTQQMALEKNWLQRHHYDCDTTQGFTAHRVCCVMATGAWGTTSRPWNLGGGGRS